MTRGGVNVRRSVGMTRGARESPAPRSYSM